MKKQSKARDITLGDFKQYYKAIVRLIKKKKKNRKRAQINKIRNEKEMKTDLTEI